MVLKTKRVVLKKIQDDRRCKVCLKYLSEYNKSDMCFACQEKADYQARVGEALADLKRQRLLESTLVQKKKEKIVYLKQCSRCGQEKPPGDFHKNRNSRDGLRRVCKDCRNQTQKTRVAQLKTKQGNVVVESQTCPKCGQVKPASGFNKSSSTRSGLQSWCRACANTAKRQG